MVDRAESPYTVPLTELESVRVPPEEQLTAQPHLRYADPAPPATPLFPDASADGDGD